MIALSRRERLRRVALLCCEFMRNLAYYRTGFPGEPREPREFWVTVNGNFLDQCVLVWGKLIGDRKAQHHWANIVSDPGNFEPELLRHLKFDAEAFKKYRDSVHEYRDRFVAHLDAERVMTPPKLDPAKLSVEFYYSYIAKKEVKPSDLSGLPANEAELREYYDARAAEAAHVYADIRSERNRLRKRASGRA
jgi:hypothetical protein